MNERNHIRLAPICIGVAALMTTAAVAATATARTDPHARPASAARTIRDGYYADSGNVKSAAMTFFVKHHGTRTSDLGLLCVPKDKTLIQGSGDAGVAVVAPTLKISHGRISYHGTAIVKPFSAGEKQTGTSTLTIKLHHVTGPVVHYVYEGNHLSETTAWKGTVFSPVCERIGDDGHATLFGPTTD